MADRPMFSVVIPFYNCERYIEAAVCSVTGQTFSDIEVILVDDASEDGSHGIAARLAADDRRVSLITLASNSGAAAARNEGIAHARGRYLMFLDADDVYEPGLMEYLGRVLDRRAPEVMVWGVVQEDYLPGEKVNVRRVVPVAKFCASEEELRKEILELERRELYGYLWNKAYLTDAFRGRDVTIPDQSFNEDEMANIMFFEHAGSALFIPKAFTRYRRKREGSLTHRYLGDYYEVAMKRVEGLLRQQARWKLYDEECRKVLAAMLLRYDLSALMRIADRRCSLSHYEKRKMVRHMRSGALGRELLPGASPDSRVLRLLAAWLQKGRIESCLLLGQAVWFVRTRMPGIYGRVAGV